MPKPKTRGGKRPGAGRPPNPEPKIRYWFWLHPLEKTKIDELLATLRQTKKPSE